MDRNYFFHDYHEEKKNCSCISEHDCEIFVGNETFDQFVCNLSQTELICANFVMLCH